MPTFIQRLRERFNKPREQPEDPDNSSRRKPAVTFVAVLLLVAVALWVVWSVPHRVVQRRMDAAHPLTVDKQLDLEDAYRKTITQIVLSVFGLYILYLSYRRAEAGDKTVRIMEQGHITDRFTKAIEQLGKTDGDKPNIEVRLGAIYALERIAFDSPRDHWTIMEVLTAYVRQNAPLEPDRPYVEGEKPRTDIQAILTVLGRRRTGPKREHSGVRLNLSNSRLCGAELPEANLQRAFLNRVDLQRALVSRANLREAFMSNANLQNAILRRADLVEANLKGINLQHTYLEEANLQKVNLGKADLREADLVKADLQKANLGEANLQQANLREANLKNANLWRVDLQEAFIWDTNLQEAQLLTAAQIKSAKCWQDAHYSPAFRAELGLAPESTEDSD